MASGRSHLGVPARSAARVAQTRFGRYARRAPRTRLSRVIEIMRFRLAPGGDEAELTAADRRLQQEFAYQQPGLLRRTTARGTDGGWIVIDLWRSASDADACAVRWDSDPAVAAFMALVDGSSVTIERFWPLD
jgi:hypothetical protein